MFDFICGLLAAMALPSGAEIRARLQNTNVPWVSIVAFSPMILLFFFSGKEALPMWMSQASNHIPPEYTKKLPSFQWHPSAKPKQQDSSKKSHAMVIGAQGEGSLIAVNSSSVQTPTDAAAKVSHSDGHSPVASGKEHPQRTPRPHKKKHKKKHKRKHKRKHKKKHRKKHRKHHKKHPHHKESESDRGSNGDGEYDRHRGDGDGEDDRGDGDGENDRDDGDGASGKSNGGGDDDGDNGDGDGDGLDGDGDGSDGEVLQLELVPSRQDDDQDILELDDFQEIEIGDEELRQIAQKYQRERDRQYQKMFGQFIFGVLWYFSIVKGYKKLTRVPTQVRSAQILEENPLIALRHVGLGNACVSCYCEPSRFALTLDSLGFSQYWCALSFGISCMPFMLCYFMNPIRKAMGAHNLDCCTVCIYATCCPSCVIAQQAEALDIATNQSVDGPCPIQVVPGRFPLGSSDEETGLLRAPIGGEMRNPSD